MPERIIARLVNRVILAREIIQRETKREALQIIRLGFVLRVRFASRGFRLRADRVFRFCERQQVALFGGVGKKRRAQNQLVAQLQIVNGNRFHPVAAGRRADDLVLQQNLHLSVAKIRRKHFVKHCQRHAWFAADARDPAAAGIEIFVRQRFFRERIIAPVKIADAGAEFLIAARAAEGFNPLVLVRRNGLLRNLAADPVGFFRHDDVEPVARRRERRRTAAHAAADDDEVGRHFPRARRGSLARRGMG